MRRAGSGCAASRRRISTRGRAKEADVQVLILGCGRVGAQLATLLDSEGHQVTVLDLEESAFRRLPPTYRGRALVGNGIDIDSLRRAGIESMDAFVACTQGDNRNVMAAQI